MANATKPEIGIAHQAPVTLTCVQPRTSFDASPLKRNIKPWGDFPLLVFASGRTRKTLEIGSIADPRGEKRFDENVMQNSIFFLHTVIITSFCASADKFLSPLVHPTRTRLLLPTRFFDFFLVSNLLPPSFWRTYSSNPPTATTTPPQSPHPLLTLVSSIRLFLRPTFEE